MEDEGYVEDDFIEEIAWEYVGLHGRAGLSLIRAQVEAAERAGDRMTAQTWRAIAEVAERIVG